MGDHRASIKITMSLHGKEYAQEWWINYSDNGDGIDQRIVDWFAECWSDGYARYEKEVAKLYAQEHREELEAAERAQLARLKEKYG